jgi:hypothetical protein
VEINNNYDLSGVYMETAKLFDLEINLAEEWIAKVSDGLSREKIIRVLEEKYRIHSQKKAFLCLCCNQPVSLVLREDSPHFRHQGDRCPSADNYVKYVNRVKSGEKDQTHRVGRAILRTYLEGQLKPRGIVVQEGYMYRTALKIVPDFILQFPNGDKWSVDYLTGSREDETYNNFILKRTATYQAAGFKPYYLIDASWIADLPDRPIVSFYLAETQIRNQSKIDQEWSAFVQEFIETFGLSFVLRELFGVLREGFGNRDFTSDFQNVYSLAYVNPTEGRASIQRFIPISKKFGYHIHSASISLEKATSLSEKLNEFQWWGDNETEDMITCLNHLSNQYEMEQAVLLEHETEMLKLRETLNHQQDQSVNFVLDPDTLTPKTNEDDSITPNLFFETTNDSIDEKITPKMTVAEAWDLHSFIRSSKSSISKYMLNKIHERACSVMGPITNPNPIPHDLREVMIELALV